MKSLLASLASLLVPAALVFLPALALADALPPDTCEAGKKAGDSCENAGDNAAQEGTCKAETCNRIKYEQDGGRGTETYECLTCTASTGGGSTTDTNDDASEGGGCSMTPGARDGLTGAGMLTLGLVAFGFSRRRRA